MNEKCLKHLIIFHVQNNHAVIQQMTQIRITETGIEKTVKWNAIWRIMCTI